MHTKTEKSGDCKLCLFINGYHSYFYFFLTLQFLESRKSILTNVRDVKYLYFPYTVV